MPAPIRIEHDLLGDRQLPGAACYGLLTREQLDEMLSPEVLTHPHLATIAKKGKNS